MRSCNPSPVFLGITFHNARTNSTTLVTVSIANLTSGFRTFAYTLPATSVFYNIGVIVNPTIMSNRMAYKLIEQPVLFSTTNIGFQVLVCELTSA